MDKGWLEERQKRLARTACRTCGGENPNVCACAREEWLNDQQKQRFARPFVFEQNPAFGAEDADDDLEREWNKLKESSVGVCAICPNCQGSSLSFCNCAKARWMKAKKEERKVQGNKKKAKSDNMVFAL